MALSKPSTPQSTTPAKGIDHKLPGGIWVLGFVSLFMDISSELVHNLLPIPHPQRFAVRPSEFLIWSVAARYCWQASSQGRCGAHTAPRPHSLPEHHLHLWRQSGCWFTVRMRALQETGLTRDLGRPNRRPLPKGPTFGTS
jgi:hypothetical protein